MNENDNFNIGKKSDINEDDKYENDLNVFLNKHYQGRNTDSIGNEINENFSLNKNLLMNNNYDIRKKSNYFGQRSIIMSKDTNYKTDPMSLVNQTYNHIINETIINNANMNYININDNNLYSNEQIEYIQYDKIINNNPTFNFIEKPTDTIFDLNLYSSVINIYDGKYENALKFIYSAKKNNFIKY